MPSRDNVVVIDCEVVAQRTAAQGTGASLARHELRELQPIEALALCRGLARVSGS